MLLYTVPGVQNGVYGHEETQVCDVFACPFLCYDFISVTYHPLAVA